MKDSIHREVTFEIFCWYSRKSSRKITISWSKLPIVRGSGTRVLLAYIKPSIHRLFTTHSFRIFSMRKEKIHASSHWRHWQSYLNWHRIQPRAAIFHFSSLSTATLGNCNETRRQYSLKSFQLQKFQIICYLYHISARQLKRNQEICSSSNSKGHFRERIIKLLILWLCNAHPNDACAACVAL